MENNYNDIDELFQKTFENFEPDPPEDLKALIDKQLKFKGKRKITHFWFYGIFVFTAILVSSLIFINTKSTHTKTLAQNKPGKTTETPIAIGTENSATGNTSHSNIKPKDTENSSSDVIDSSESYEVNKINAAKNLKAKNTLATNLKTDQTQNPEKTKISNQKINKQNNKGNSSGKKRKNRRAKSRLDKEVILFAKNDSGDGKQTNSGSETNSGNASGDSGNKSGIGSDKVVESSENKGKLALKATTKEILASALAKGDSIQKSEHLNKKDASSANNNSKKKTPATSPWILSLKTDVNLPVSKGKDPSISFSTKNALHFQLEASYMLRPKFGASSGVNYFSSTESLSKTMTSTDSTLTGYTIDYVYQDSVYYTYDSLQNPIDSTIITYIVDSTSTPNYTVQNISSSQSSSFTISSFSIPLLFNYNQKISDKLSLDLMAGGILNFQKIGFRDASNPLNNELTLNKFGFKAILKTSLRYQFNHLGVSLNNNLIYDFSPVKQISSTRKNLSYGLGFGVYWRF